MADRPPSSGLMMWPGSGTPGAGAWHTLLTTWKIWYLSFAFILTQFSVATIVYFNPLIVEAMFHGGWSGTAPKRTFSSEREAVLHEARIALVSAILWVVVALAMILNAASSKYFNERNLHCAIPQVIAGVCYMLVPVMLKNQGPIAGYTFLIIGAAAVEATYGPIASWPKTFLYGQSAALSLAFVNSFAAIGGFAGPFVMGRLAGLPGGYSTAMIVMGCINLFNGFLLFCFRPGNIEDQSLLKTGSVRPLESFATAPESVDLSQGSSQDLKV
eukprot:jgi/Botrbrau1/5389/Bobra.0346s0049.1